MLDNPRSVEYLPIVTGMKWQFGPEPSILRGTIGSASVTINNDIYLMSGWEHISHRYFRHTTSNITNKHGLDFAVK